jgi:7-cyano-7-deazaguanine synthase in queuosine biosynthesis
MRNLFLASYASLYDSEVSLVVQKGEMDIPDRSNAFFTHLSALTSYLQDKCVKISTPFADWTKTQMVNWYLRNVNDQKGLMNTRSCYGVDDLPCGACSACFRRWVALTNNGLKEPYTYDVLDYYRIPFYLERIVKGELEKTRSAETISALRKGGYFDKHPHPSFT